MPKFPLMLTIFWASRFGKENATFGRKLAWTYREISAIKSGPGVRRSGRILHAVNTTFIESYTKVCK
uniref:Uncharacterized protein n=1 Tax=Physcomitrium patens TaxID=3218 RepID=A0A2K1IEP8_PHYPA|nr:hypothetical protein PHYPA_029898 [Physcomitrium patens]